MRITISYAQTLDGRIATRTGDSQWISGPESLRVAHRLRATHDAVMVGVNTVITDDPRLTTRLVEGRSPIRVVLDSRLRIPLGAKLLRDGAAETIVVTTGAADARRRQTIEGLGSLVLGAPSDPDGRIDLQALLHLLEQRGIHSLLVEGGAAVITSVLRGRLCDRLVVCIAPRIIGHGIEAVGSLGIDRLDDGLRFASVSLEPCGDDLIFDGALAAVAVA